MNEQAALLRTACPRSSRLGLIPDELYNHRMIPILTNNDKVRKRSCQLINEL